MKQIKKKVNYKLNNKMTRCKFEIDQWGFYITPLIGYSNMPKHGKRLWFGWLKYLWTINI